MQAITTGTARRALMTLTFAVSLGACTESDSVAKTDSSSDALSETENERCWNEEHFCKGGVGYLQTYACDLEAGICCTFGTTCIPCGWTECWRGNCPKLDPPESPECRGLIDGWPAP